MKILAIDIGTAHIKTVIVETKFKRFDIVLHDITSVPDAWEPTSPGEQLLSPGQLATLAEVNQRYGAGVNRIVTNLPYSLYSSRFQHFPLKDKRKVLSAVKLAIEDEIPFDFEQCVLTSQLYPGKGKETDVLTGYAPLAPLEQFLENLSAIHLSPDVFMMEDVANASLFQRVKGEKLRNVAILNLGHRKSSMYFLKGGLPVLHRNTMVGGYHVTAAIAHRYSIGAAEAELAKIERGFLASPGMKLSTDQEVFADTIRESLEPVFSDFQQSLLAYSSRFNEQVDAIYICGGTSLLPGLVEYLTARWQKRVLPLQIRQLFPNISIQPQGGLELFLPIACAIGLSQVNGEGRSQINFRTGKLYAAGKGLQLNFSQFIYPAKLALTLYIVAMLSVIGQIFFLNREIKNKDDQLSRAMQTVFGRVSSSFVSGLKSNPTRLRQSVAKKIEEAQAEVKGGSKSASDTLGLLDSMSKEIPKSTTLEIKQLDLRANKIDLTVDAPTQSEAERASAALSRLTTLLLNPKLGPIEAGKGTRRKFTLSATIAPKRGG